MAAVGSADNNTLSTSPPDLVSVTAQSARQVRACFSVALATTYNLNDSNFYLQGYTESRKTGGPGGALSITGSPQPDPSSSNCVIINYAPNSSQGGDVRTYSRAVVGAGAVTSSAGQLNVQDSVALSGSEIPPHPGTTTRPLLTGATVSGQLVTYTFNQPVYNPTATGFGFYNNVASDGNEHIGTQILNFHGGDSTVTVLFSVTAEGASRFVVDAGAVQDANNVNGPVGYVGGASTHPDLASTGGRVSSSASGAVYTFVFDQPVSVSNAAGFAAYDAAGNLYDSSLGSPPTVSADGRTVTVTLVPDSSDASPDPAQITLETVAAGSVVATTGGLGNSQGSLGVNSVADHPGLTTGPDLLSFSINTSNGNVTYNFDAPLSTTTADTVIADFHIVEANGQLIAPPNQCASGGILGGGTAAPVYTLSGNTVVVDFAVPGAAQLLGGCGTSDLTNVTNAVGVSVDEGAVKDQHSAVVNPLSSLGLGTASTGTGASGASGTSGATGPTGTSGATGASGATGTSGASGTSGTGGTTTTGTSGTSGTTGGTTGNSGSSGTSSTPTTTTVTVVQPTVTVIEKVPTTTTKKPTKKKKPVKHKKKKKKKAKKKAKKK